MDSKIKILSMLALVASSQLAFGVQDQEVDKTSTSEKHTTVSDSDLKKAIHHKIAPGWFSKGYDKVNFDVINGNVTLKGSVKNNKEKETVEKDVRNIPGVRNVESFLVIEEISDQPSTYKKDFAHDRAVTPADEQLNKRIRDNVSIGWTTNSYKEVGLKTNNGVVILEGIVSNTKDQQNLIDAIRKIEGVRTVQSNLIIKNR